MCDCIQEQNDEVVEKVALETITIFSRCTAQILETVAQDDTDWIPTDSVQSTSNHTGCECTRKSSTSTESSSELSQTVRQKYPQREKYNKI